MEVPFWPTAWLEVDTDVLLALGLAVAVLGSGDTVTVVRAIATVPSAVAVEVKANVVVSVVHGLEGAEDAACGARLTG